VTGTEKTLAKIRRIVPEGRNPGRCSAEVNIRLLEEIRAALYPQAKIRNRIVALVREREALRMTQIRDMLGLGSGASGHLAALVAQGRLEKGGRGVYFLPGCRPEVLPGWPTEKIAAAARNRNGRAYAENSPGPAR
jgi:hypothetical protein